jgi:hypothetical protein
VSVSFPEYHDDAILRRILWRKCSLRVHMAALSGTLVDDQAGRRYVASVPGRGNRFVAKRSRVGEALSVAASACAATDEPTHNLPMLHTRAIGRAKIATSLGSYLLRGRSITLIGRAKITVALATAEALRASGWRHCEESHRCRR